MFMINGNTDTEAERKNKSNPNRQEIFNLNLCFPAVDPSKTCSQDAGFRHVFLLPTSIAGLQTKHRDARIFAKMVTWGADLRARSTSIMVQSPAHCSNTKFCSCDDLAGERRQ
jgi:hypothetical protein